ncbi:MAG: glycosyltransferase family 2 protein [Candidatus Kerfeldbacteria bacterium]|nr:glycosyltransferase family 2 protein [Candidatus Kerfeldbacteria bacterium]
MRPNLTAIVVSWNVRGQLSRCLKSLADSTGVKIKSIVVDNASADGSADFVHGNFPDITLIRNQTNRGFAAAVNQGLAEATSDVVLVNPDIELRPETLAVMHQRMYANHSQRVGIVGPKLIYPNGSLQPSVKRFPDWFDLFLILSKVPNLLPNLTKRYNALDLDYRREQIVDQVMGSCFMIKRACLDDVGFFDEGFWIWFEEVDFCKRASLQNWWTLYTPAAPAVHTRGASFAQSSTTAKQQALRHSIIHYSRKYFGVLKTRLLFPAELMSIISAPLIDALNLKKPTAAKDF